MSALSFLNSLNPTITASCIAVFGTVLGAIVTGCLTHLVTGYNQRKHLEKESDLKAKRELEEQKKIILLELMEYWKDAFHQAGFYLNLVVRHRILNNLPMEEPIAEWPVEFVDMVEKMTTIFGNLRHQQCKYFLFYGESELYQRIILFHQNLTLYGMSIAQYGETAHAAERIRLLDEREVLVKLFRELLQNHSSTPTP